MGILQGTLIPLVSLAPLCHMSTVATALDGLHPCAASNAIQQSTTALRALDLHATKYVLHVPQLWRVSCLFVVLLPLLYCCHLLPKDEWQMYVPLPLTKRLRLLNHCCDGEYERSITCIDVFGTVNIY